jgi:16S rRNA (cytosine967-C5)-methyltransferase
VLDYCAGAGGKTLLLAGELRGRGELYAHDPDQERLDRLEQRARRAGATNLHLLREPPPPELRCDRVLVDAPCSELGTLRRGPDARFRISPADAEALPDLQLEILTRASQHLGAGGVLVYATCTLRRAENEGVIERFLERRPAFALRPAGAGWLGEELRRGPFFASAPHRHGMDGFFAAVLQRS